MEFQELIETGNTGERNRVTSIEQLGGFEDEIK